MPVTTTIANLIYLAPFWANRYQAAHADETVLARGATKMITLGGDKAVKLSLAWVVSKRGVLILSDKRMVCGSWSLDLEDVESASYVEGKGIFAKGLVLKVASKDGAHYQFGLGWDPAWLEQDALKLTKAEEGIGVSIFSVLLRLAIIAYLVYLAVRDE